MQRIHPRIALRGFKPGARGTAHVLGELESAVMETLWAQSSPGLIESKNILSRNKSTWLFLTVPLLSLLGVFVFAPLSVHHAAETFIEILK